MSEGNGHKRRGRKKETFTPTEKKILLALSDKKLHSKEELHDLLPDEIGRRDTGGPNAFNTLMVHLNRIRRKLSSEEAIICDRSNGTKYRYVSFDLNPKDIILDRE